MIGNKWGIGLRRGGSGLAGLVMALSLWAPARAQDLQYAPPGLLTLDSRADLSILAEHLALTPTALFVSGQNRAGGQVMKLSPADLALLVQVEVDLEVQDLLASPNADRLYLIGHKDDQTLLLILDGQLQPLGQLSLGQMLAAPAISPVGDGLVAISGLRNGKSDGVLRILDVHEAAGPNWQDSSNLPIAARGVARGWFFRDGNLAFVNAGDAAALLAISTESGRTLSDISGPPTKDPRVEPLAILGTMPDQPCRMGDTPSFLISSVARDRLTLAEYTPVFGTLNILSEVEPGLSGRSGDPALQQQDGTDVLRPLGLLASSCNLQVVWAGSRSANGVVQYAVSPNSRLLEKVGTISLPGRPVDLAVSQDGLSAFALFGNGHIQRFAAVPGNDGLILGAPDVRALQRALTEKGYPVGQIDGMLGARTNNALKQFQAQTGIVVDTTQDINAAIQAITGALK